MRSSASLDVKPGPWVTQYPIDVVLNAPLKFAYSWCTDFSPLDSKLEKGTYTRWILEKTLARIVFEDLAKTKTGWSWQRCIVTLNKRNRWRMEMIGNYRDVIAHYKLIFLGANRTRLELRYKVRQTLKIAPMLTRTKRDQRNMQMWQKFSKA